MAGADQRNIAYASRVAYIADCIAYRREEISMPSKRLTDATVQKIKLPDKLNPDGTSAQRQIRYIDTMERGLALVLVVSYGGTKTFRVMTYRDGKPQTYKLGMFPQMSVAAAKEKARDYWKAPEKFTAKAESGSFQEVADNFLKRHVDHNALISAPEIRRQLNVYVLPKWKDRKFIEIRRKDVNHLLDHIADKHGHRQADAVLATISKMCSWYQARDEDYVSPIVKGMKRSNGNNARDRILTDEEIRLIWSLDGRYDSILKLCLLTAQRKEKVAEMKRSDINDGTWTVYTPPRKPHESKPKGTIGEVRLPQQAMVIINGQPIIHGNEYVFASSRTNRFSNWANAKKQWDKKLGFKDWTIHDLRRTARSLMARGGISDPIAEKVMGHELQGILAIYNRHKYTDEKSAALDSLAKLIQSIIDPPPQIGK
jgi:integrase